MPPQNNQSNANSNQAPKLERLDELQQNNTKNRLVLNVQIILKTSNLALQISKMK